MGIVTWLREQAANDFTCEAKLLEAADLIGRLNRDVRQLQGICDRSDIYIARMSEYIVQLESAIVHLEQVIFRLEGK